MWLNKIGVAPPCPRSSKIISRKVYRRSIRENFGPRKFVAIRYHYIVREIYFNKVDD